MLELFCKNGEFKLHRLLELRICRHDMGFLTVRNGSKEKCHQKNSCKCFMSINKQ